MIRDDLTGKLVGTVRADSRQIAVKRASAVIRKRGFRSRFVVIRKAIATRDGRWLSRETCESMHESGHALVGIDLGLRVSHVTLADEHHDGAGGTCEIEIAKWLHRYLRGGRPMHEPREPWRRTLLRSLIVQSTAGRAAERRLLGRRPPHNFWPAVRGSDSSDAAACAKLLGLRGKRIKPFVRACERDADAILERRWVEVVRLAAHVEARWRQRVGSKDIDRIVKGGEATAAKRRAKSPYPCDARRGSTSARGGRLTNGSNGSRGGRFDRARCADRDRKLSADRRRASLTNCYELHGSRTAVTPSERQVPSYT
jgi:hypothetical protein